MPKLYYKFTQLWCLVCSSKRSIYLPMENYGLQTCIFLFCFLFCFPFFFFFCELRIENRFQGSILKLQVFDISSAKHKSFFDQSTIKRLGKLKLLSYYEVKPLLLILFDSEAYFGTFIHWLFAWKLYICTNKSSFYVNKICS